MNIFQGAYDFWRPNKYKLQPYLLDDGKKHPFALICPGGSYAMVCSCIEGLPIAKELNKRGYHAFVLYYRVKSKAKYPNPQLDVKRALEEIREHAEEWNVDMNGWALFGSSAGGHLAASYCLEDGPKPSCLVLSYPVISMGEYTERNTKKNLIGLDASQAMIDKLSVEKHIQKGYPPTFVWFGTADKIVDIKNGEMFHGACLDADVPCVFKIYEGVAHGVGLAKKTSAENWLNEAISFWKARQQN